MKKTGRILSLLLVFLLTVTMVSSCGSSTGSGEREITDMAGRTVTIPAADEIQKVYAGGSTAGIYVYTLAPDKLLGWSFPLNDVEKSMIPEKYHDLPAFGMAENVNYETVIEAGPQICINVGTLGDAFTDECDKLQENLGIPVVAVDGDLLKSSEAYEFMGEVLGMEEEAGKLSDYIDNTFDQLDKMDIKDSEKVSVYYGNGENYLDTAPEGSSHAQILDLVKADNVADLELGEGGRVQVSAEQVLAWDPDVVLLNGEPKADLTGPEAAEKFLKDPTYSTLKAVKNSKVYGTPNAPFSWVDRPPATNRIIGLKWLSSALYPDKVEFDLDKEVKEFFQLFYHVELTDDQLTKLYNSEI